MKKIVKTLLCRMKTRCLFVILSIGLLVGHAQAVELRWIGPAGGTVSVGETFDVMLELNNLSFKTGHSVSYFDFDILYNTTALKLVGGTFGANGVNSLDYPGAEFEFIGYIDDSHGLIDVAAISGNSNSTLDKWQPNDFIGVTLSFMALTADPMATIELLLNDPWLAVYGTDNKYMDVYMDEPVLTLNVTGAGPIPPANLPEPHIAGLLGLSSLLLLRYRSKSRHR